MFWIDSIYLYHTAVPTGLSMVCMLPDFLPYCRPYGTIDSMEVTGFSIA